MNFFQDLSIRSKHLVILALVIGGLILTVSFSAIQFSQIEQLRDITLREQQLKSHIFELRKYEKDFLLYKKQTYLEGFRQAEQQIDSDLNALLQQLENNDLSTELASELGSSLKSYRTLFSKLAATQIEIGLTPKTGLYGSLRNAVHEVESLAKAQQEYELLFHMLMLRRNEKDFMLRRDMKYLAKFEKNIAKFNNTLNTLQLESGEEIRNKLAIYEKISGRYSLKNNKLA